MDYYVSDGRNKIDNFCVKELTISKKLQCETLMEEDKPELRRNKFLDIEANHYD